MGNRDDQYNDWSHESQLGFTRLPAMLNYQVMQAVQCISSGTRGVFHQEMSKYIYLLYIYIHHIYIIHMRPFSKSLHAVDGQAILQNYW